MNENLSAIVSFNIREVELAQVDIIGIFTEMDDGIGMPIEHRKVAAQALFNRIISGEEIHLLAEEADYIKLKAPNTICAIKYYE